MSGSIAPARFHELDWKVLAYETCTHFRTGSLAEGVALTRAVERLVESSSRQPDLDLRTNGVTVRLKGTKKGELGEDDLALAADISAAARALEIPVDLTGLQSFQIAIDALDIPGVMHFWEAVLGYVQIGDILRPSLRGTGVLVPADGCAATAAQPDPCRSLPARRSGESPRRGGPHRRRTRRRRRERARVVDARRSRGQRGRRRPLAGRRPGLTTMPSFIEVRRSGAWVSPGRGEWRPDAC
jgi:pterin-4a-carbinolamine dehydratase